jgi:hypothetical protein
MCSTTSERLTRIGMAIDELAADSLAADHAGSDTGMQDRLARIWAMIAELDPELARRMPRYGPGPADERSPAPRALHDHGGLGTLWPARSSVIMGGGWRRGEMVTLRAMP